MTKRKCLTPGAFYHFKNDVYNDTLEFSVIVPSDVSRKLSKHRCKLLEKAFHDAIEATLGPVWPKKPSEPDLQGLHESTFFRMPK